MSIERPETITVQFRTDLLYAMMNVLEVSIDNEAHAYVKWGEIKQKTLDDAIQGFNDLVTSVDEAFGSECWVDYGIND